MAYVDGFVLVVPKKNVAAYKKMATKASKIWTEHGALQYVEAVGDDLKTKMGLPFPKMAGAKSTETIVFAWITYKSRKHRDEVNKKVMKDARIHDMMPKEMPFDVEKMAYGGFEYLVSAAKKK